MPRKKRPLDREAGIVRDASLIVIASEDTYAVKQYFSRFKTRRVQFAVAHTEDCRSAPNHVIERLKAFRDEHATVDGDTFWLCIDRDKWHPAVLSRVLSDCRALGFEIAISQPCFELWILLHYEEYSVASAQSASELDARLREILGGYTKQCCRTLQLTKESVIKAMERARAMDIGTELLPLHPVTRVYKILEELLKKDAIEFV